MKNFPESVLVFENNFFSQLTADYSFASGHMSIVHSDRWLIVYVYASSETKEDKMGQVISRADSLTKELWPEQICRHKYSLGKTPDGVPFYTFWLAISPERHAEDFKNFFPAMSSK